MRAEPANAARIAADDQEGGPNDLVEEVVPTDEGGVTLSNFYAYLPSHAYIFEPTGELWPAASVDGRVPWPKGAKGSPLKPSRLLDAQRSVEQMVWAPAKPRLILDEVMVQAGWHSHPGASVFNLYRAPSPPLGDPTRAGPWREHLSKVYPGEAEHLERWLAHRVQRPGEKVNHAIVLGGAQGVGKDTILEPVKAGVGAWNWSDISPTAMLGRFSGWAKAVVVRVNEGRDLGDVDRFAFYDHSKTYIAAPPDVLRVDEKHLREHYVSNVCGVILTTNHKLDGLYLPADDRRHFVAWSEAKREDFDGDYWNSLWGWYAKGGIGHVVAHLATLDLTDFDPKAPPPKTAAFWAMVSAGEAPESGELRDVIEELGDPDVLTVAGLVSAATRLRMLSTAEELQDRRNRRALPHRLERVGYTPVRNPDAEDGLFKPAGRRVAVYARKGLTVADQVAAARSFRSVE